MKSRLAVVLALTFGLFASGTGVTLGVTALNSTDSAAKAQYGPGDCEEGSDVNANECGGVLGDGGSGSANDLQATGQTAAAGSDSLPFTGYAAIPVLLIGIALIGGGLMLRRRLETVRE